MPLQGKLREKYEEDEVRVRERQRDAFEEKRRTFQCHAEEAFAECFEETQLSR